MTCVPFPHVSVVIVTWNGLHLLEPCLASLARQTVPFELVVVDNGSTDGTAEWVAREARHVRFVAVADNLGFAQANNIGIRASSGAVIVLINNDTLPPPTFIQDLVQPLIDDPFVGAIAGVLVFAHRPDLVASAGIVPGRDGVHRDYLAMVPVASLPDAPMEVFGASGGAMGIRRAALDDVGVFDSGYFNYLEDADLVWRLRLRGWRTMLAPKARLPHIYSATSGHASPFKQRLLARNRLRVLVRCWPWALLLRCAPTIVWYDLLAIAYGIVMRQPKVVEGRLDALRQLRSLLWERVLLQRHTKASANELLRWLGPALSVRDVIEEGQRLDQILRDRAS